MLRGQLPFLLVALIWRPSPESLRLEVVELSPPAGLESSIRSELATVGQRVIDPAGIVATFWMRRALAPVSSSDPSPPTRSALPQRRIHREIEPGQLLAAVDLAQPWKDARGEEIAAGLYTLRYVLQPALKDHLGTSRYADFLLLIPANIDRGTTVRYSPQQAVEESSKHSPSERHPMVLSLVPAGGEGVGSLELGREGRWVLTVQIGSHSFGIVLAGPAPDHFP